ncbi:hypothetical protein [Enterovibrio norvegicus]|uniref:hypothetical protein n=1 Tax=Enterovibrio norvegicus TaxID=188144 RepID=UPI0010543A7B|nr:hypothetical protein [Enterovibrio norvegicus]TKF28432.1 hypothetical protein FCV83_22930 [Enterovibrio norvegicus]
MFKEVMSLTEVMSIFLKNLPFMITICVVLAGAFVTYRSNRKSIESQNLLASKARDAAHQDKISEFRHAWIQEVRKTSAELSQTLHECKMHYTLKQREFDHAVRMSGTQSGNQNHLDACEKFEAKYIESRAKFYQLYSKIVLLFKPSDSQTEKLITLLNDTRTALYDNPLLVTDESIDAILVELQQILKSEWEVTKSRTWVTNT